MIKMMNMPKNLGALGQIDNGIVKASRTFEDMGYPSNLPDEDKAYIIKRLIFVNKL